MSKLFNVSDAPNVPNVPKLSELSKKFPANSGGCSRAKLLALCNEWLEPSRFKDYCPNGLQVEGAATISRIALAVTANQAAIEAAIAWGAQALLTHHGLMWKGEDGTVTGFRHARLKTILAADLNMLAYHLPLDAHPTLGNNAQIAQKLGILNATKLDKDGILWTGDIPDSMATAGGLCAAIDRHLNPPRPALLIMNSAISTKPIKPLRRIAWCTGGGGSYFEQAIASGADVFLTGEASEQHVHIARESGVSLVLAGHHATERYGIQALGAAVSAALGVESRFFEIDSPL
jgi:dinuclear metal center YbgI/SA1388 family protein